MLFKKFIKGVLRRVIPNRLIAVIKNLETIALRNNLETKNDTINPERIANLERLIHKEQGRRRWERLRGSGKKKVLVEGYLTGKHTHLSAYLHLRDILTTPLFDIAAIDFAPIDRIKESLVNECVPDITSYERKMYGRIPFLDTSLILDAVSAQTYLSKSRELAAAAMSVVYLFVEDILNFYKPDLVLVWGFYSPAARVFRALCKKRRIPVASTEYGVLPGTVCFDFMGHMATSWISRRSDYFNTLPVDETDIDNAKKYIEMGRDPKYSRNILPPISEEIKSKLNALRASGKKIIIHIASSSAYSGNSSCEEEAASLHSPLFKDDFEVYLYLLELCKKHEDWHILYKPHPLERAFLSDIDSRRTTVIKEEGLYESLDFADCAITILSQGAYISLLKDTPLILLGRLQLNDSGAAYTIKQKEELESAIVKAVSEGFTEEQRRKFTEHTARVLKYYAYKSYPEIPTDRDMNRFSKDLLSVMEGGEPEHLKYEREAYLKQCRSLSE